MSRKGKSKFRAKVKINKGTINKEQERQLWLEEGKRQGRDWGFQTGLYLALIGYYNTMPEDLMTDEEFGQWSKRAEAECTRVFNNDVKGDYNGVQAIPVSKVKETINDRVEYTMLKLDELRERLRMNDEAKV